MTLVQASLWLVVLVILAVINLWMAFNNIRTVKRGRADSALSFLWNFLVGLLCIYAGYVAVERIAKYQEAPRVYTSTPPQVDTLNRPDKTIYVYKFQDNTWPNLR